MSRLGWLVLLATLYALHQDLWFWREARPLVFGVLPVGLAYHGGYCLLVSAVMWLLTRRAWPAHLEREPQPAPDGRPTAARPKGERRR